MQSIGVVIRSSFTDRDKVNTVTDITPVLQAIQSFGNWVLFFWLFVRQMERTQKVSDAHKDDLRSLAEELLVERKNRTNPASQDATD